MPPRTILFHTGLNKKIKFERIINSLLKPTDHVVVLHILYIHLTLSFNTYICKSIYGTIYIYHVNIYTYNIYRPMSLYIDTFRTKLFNQEPRLIVVKQKDKV